MLTGGFSSTISPNNVLYELNISYFDAINDPNLSNDTLAVKRFIASQAIMTMLKGVPGIYIHSLLGSRNYYKGVEETGIKRMINREKMPWHSIEASLSEVTSQPYQILDGLLHLLNVRGQIPSFHPSSTREVIDSDKRLIIIKRSFRGETVWAVINVSQFEIALPEYKGRPNVVGNEIFDGNVEPYGVYILAFP